MTTRPHTLPRTLLLITLLTVALPACKTETIEVTRIKIMERRVIERVIVTVEVTRIHHVVETPRPTLDALAPPNPNDDVNLTPLPSLPPPTVTPAPPRPATAATETPPSAQALGERLLVAIKDIEQTFLSLVQALNSDPLPRPRIIELYAALQLAPTFTLPADEAELQSVHARYREQVDYVLDQSADLYIHLVQIESGQATQMEVSPTHLALARNAASASTSTLQGLIRELEGYLASLP
jgi:hypothetical protein